MYYLYILYSPGSDLDYIGHTENWEGRVFQHNNSDIDTFTSLHRPWELAACFEAGATRGDALKLERFIKKQKSRALIDRLISPDFVPSGSLAQLIRVPHVRDQSGGPARAGV